MPMFRTVEETSQIILFDSNDNDWTLDTQKYCRIQSVATFIFGFHSHQTHSHCKNHSVRVVRVEIFTKHSMYT